MPTVILQRNDAAAGAGYTFVQSAGNGTTGASSLVVTLGSAPAVGDLVVAVVGSRGTNNITAPTSTGATWTRAVLDATQHLAIYYSTSVSTTAITLNLSSIAGFAGIVLHATGAAASPLDQTSSAAAASPGSITPVQDGEFIVTGVLAGSSPTGPSGYTVPGVTQSDGANVHQVAYLIQSTAAATNPAWSTGSPSVIASFKHA